jgi:hypothetical protein
MYSWPWRRFEAFFARHLVRKAAEEMARRRDLELAAISANTNWDDKENQDIRRQKVEAINEGYKQGVEILYGTREPENEPDPIESDPLFRTLRSQGESLRAGVAAPQLAEAGLGRQVLDAS